MKLTLHQMRQNKQEMRMGIPVYNALILFPFLNTRSWDLRTVCDFLKICRNLLGKGMFSYHYVRLYSI